MPRESRQEREERRYPFQYERVLIAALIFTIIVAWQADLAWTWWLPALIAFAFIFAGMHAFYNWANLKLNAMGKRAREAGEEF